MVPTFLPDNEYTRSELAAYYQSISRVDDGVGRLTEILKKSEQWDNTLIIYISDNGMAFPGAKTTLYESGIHLPCIVKTPGQNLGKTSEALISWADLTPTILDVLGIQINGKFHGKSFKCVLEDDCEATKDTIFVSHTFHAATHYYPMRAIRTKSHKLIWNLAHELEFPNSLSVSTTWKGMQKKKQQLGQRRIADFLNRPEFELYDLIEDPNEVNNLADDSAYEKLRNDLWQSIKHWQKDTGDPWMKEDEVLKLWKKYPWPHYQEE